MEIHERADITVSETDDRTTINLLGSRGQVLVGGEALDGYVFVRDEDGREHVRLDGRAGSVYAGGDGASGRIFLRKTIRSGSGESDRVTMRFDGDRGNIRAGGSGCDGDLLLFPEDVSDIQADAEATIWLDSRYGNMALGGNGRDGDLLVFPRDATISTTRSAAANLWLDGDRGDLHLTGGLKPKGGPERARTLPEYSTDEGAVSSFESDERFGLVEFRHEHRPAPGDREKLRNIHIFNPLLHENTIVHVTSHAGGPCVPCISYLSRPDVSGGSGRFIDLHMIHKLPPGNDVRILYWIMN